LFAQNARLFLSLRNIAPANAAARFMVVTQDNQNGDTEANLVKVDVKK
jgi:hypothetical protein